MEALEKIAAVLKDKNWLIEVANACDKAYSEGTGNPTWYTPYGEEKPEKVAQNMAGLQAVISGISIIAKVRGAENAKEIDEMALDILTEIVENTVSDLEKNVLLGLANCAWGAGQPFRTDKGVLGRLTGLNVFDLLDAAEVAKDFHQIQAAADKLYEKVA